MVVIITSCCAARDNRRTARHESAMRLSATSHTHIHAHRTHTHTLPRALTSECSPCSHRRPVSMRAHIPSARILSRLHATNTTHRRSDALASLGDHYPDQPALALCPAVALGSQECRPVPGLGSTRRPHGWPRNVCKCAKKGTCRPSNLAWKRGLPSQRSCSKPRRS